MGPRDNRAVVKMAEYCGKVLEITAIEVGYYILADDDRWYFADFMLEG